MNPFAWLTGLTIDTMCPDVQEYDRVVSEPDGVQEPELPSNLI